MTKRSSFVIPPDFPDVAVIVDISDSLPFFMIAKMCVAAHGRAYNCKTHYMFDWNVPIVLSAGTGSTGRRGSQLRNSWAC
jgi:hypothetical protein